MTTGRWVSGGFLLRMSNVGSLCPALFHTGMKAAADQDSFCQEDARVSEPSAKDATP